MVTYMMELLGTVAFAASGAMTGIRKKMDILGVSVLGIVTAVGGGAIRDLVLGIAPPRVFLNPGYALVAAITAWIIFFLVYIKRDFLDSNFKVIYDKIIWTMDTLGLAIFTVSGVYAGIREGYAGKLFFLVFLGTVTGVGGGVLRDVLAGEPPCIFVKYVYASASILGSVICVYTYRFWGVVGSMVVSSMVILAVRYFAIHYHWNLPKANDDN